MMLHLIQYSFSMPAQNRSPFIVLPLFKKVSLGMALILSFASVEVYAQAASAQQQAAKEKVKESTWLSDPALTKFVQKMVESRYMPYKVLGQKDGKDVLTYKAYFRPFPADMERFYSYWGMTAAWYIARKDSMAQEGYEEIWHQSYRDAANTELHQAVWQKTSTANPDLPRLGSNYADEEHEQNILVAMLWRGEFKKLDVTLGSGFAQNHAGRLKSNTLYARFATLSRLDKDFGKQFDSWVKSSQLGYAHLARGMFLQEQAWEARGGKFAAETSKAQFAGFHKLSAQARIDFNKANEKIMACAMCAGELIGNNKALSMQADDANLLKAAIKQDPSLYSPAYAYLGTLLPQWGGSFEQIEAFIINIGKATGDQVLVEQLKSRLCYYRGNAIYKGDPEGARVWFEKGLNSQPYQLLVNELALMYAKKNNHQQSIILLEKSLANGNEWDIYTLEALAQSYFALGMQVKGDKLIAKRDEAVRRFKNGE
ncbi:hypothetical protein DFR42_11463 [Undibacterium pigrum]|uniref:DUF4034 domain-containing protein n=2 Tax=Undibacterium pigrum TaxID=401470 RepID=A0A318ISC0_9BURK|nr:hypothetical protein DFR42_11463 [Undibacterium pigrum]